MTDPACVICGATSRSRYTDELQWVCEEHWGHLSLKMRCQWWNDTDYGGRPPSLEIINVLKAYCE